MSVLLESLRRRQVALTTQWHRKRAGSAQQSVTGPRYAAIGNSDVTRFADPAACLDSVDTQTRSAVFVCTSGEIDREGDVVIAQGIHLDSFARNPVILYAHREGEGAAFPVGTARAPDGSLAVWVNDDKLIARAYFHDLTDTARTCFDLIKGGFLSGVSLGFVPLRAQKLQMKAGPSDRNRVFRPRYLFEEIQLMEISVCPVPVQPDALLVGRSWPATRPEPEIDPADLDRLERQVDRLGQVVRKAVRAGELR